MLMILALNGTPTDNQGIGWWVLPAFVLVAITVAAGATALRWYLSLTRRNNAILLALTATIPALLAGQLIADNTPPGGGIFWAVGLAVVALIGTRQLTVLEYGEDPSTVILGGVGGGAAVVLIVLLRNWLDAIPLTIAGAIIVIALAYGAYLLSRNS